MVSLLAAVGLVLADAYISYRRIKTYGAFAELNPLVRQAIADFGVSVGIGVGLAYNFGVLAYLFFGHPRLLDFFCGAKAGLFLMQLKSMQMESFVERVLAKARAKKQVS